jgi:hypothetical protein
MLLLLSAAVVAAQCTGPSSPGVSICSPPNGAKVSFGDETPFVVVSAAGKNTNGTNGMDVWLDGTKLGFFDGTTVNLRYVPAIPGSHELDIFAVGLDGELQLARSFFVVSGGGACPAPGPPGVSICLPANGRPLTSPFDISAAGTNSSGTAGLDVWMDGTKLGFFANTNVKVFGQKASPGPHELDIFAVGLNGELKLQKSFFTVLSAAVCPIPGSPAVNICAPAGTSLVEPFTISAAGRNTNLTNGMDVWLDGTKLGFFANTMTVNINNVSSLGDFFCCHQLDIFAVGADGELILQSLPFARVSISESCIFPNSPGVNICSPTSTGVHRAYTPLFIRALGRNSTTTAGMDVWIDGTKIGFYPDTLLQISVESGAALEEGNHRLDIFAVGVDGELQLGTVTYHISP